MSCFSFFAFCYVKDNNIEPCHRENWELWWLCVCHASFRICFVRHEQKSRTHGEVLVCSALAVWWGCSLSLLQGYHSLRALSCAVWRVVCVCVSFKWQANNKMAVWSKRRVVLSAAGSCCANALTATPDSRSAAALLLLPNKLYMHVKEHASCFCSGGAANFTTLRSAQSERAIEPRISMLKQCQVAVILAVVSALWSNFNSGLWKHGSRGKRGGRSSHLHWQEE